MISKIIFIGAVIVSLVGAQLAVAEKSDDESLNSMSANDPCRVWVAHADSIAKSMALYREYEIDYRSDLEENFELEDYETGSAGKELLTEAMDGASAGLPDEQIIQNTLEKCRSYDPEWVTMGNATIRIPSN